MRYVVPLTLAAGCTEVLDLPDQLVSYEELSVRMCGCDGYRLQSAATDDGGTKSLQDRCSQRVEALYAGDQTEPLEQAVEAGCDRCGAIEATKDCYAIIAPGLPDGAPCSSPLDCASFACAVSQVDFDLTPPIKVPMETAWECVPACVGCASPSLSSEVRRICKDSLTTLDAAGCQGGEGEGGGAGDALYALFVELSSCDAAELVCQSQPSRPVSP